MDITTLSLSKNETSTALHKQGAFDMDDKAVFRSLAVVTVIAVIIGVWLTVKIYKQRKLRSRVRRYDILTTKQLAPDLFIGSDDSDEEVFGLSRADESNRRLVPSAQSRLQ